MIYDRTRGFSSGITNKAGPADTMWLLAQAHLVG